MERDDTTLADFFAAARHAAPAPSDALIARILADAEAAMPRGAEGPVRPGPAPRRGGLLSWLGAFGGWGGVGGLATATLAGLWFGYAGLSDPSSLAASVSAALTGGGTAAETTDLLPGGETVALVAGWEG
jgi:hypothetical protein